MIVELQVGQCRVLMYDPIEGEKPNFTAVSLALIHKSDYKMNAVSDLNSAHQHSGLRTEKVKRRP